MNLLAFIKHQIFHIVFQHSEKNPPKLILKFSYLSSVREAKFLPLTEDGFSPQKSRDFSPSSIVRVV